MTDTYDIDRGDPLEELGDVIDAAPVTTEDAVSSDTEGGGGQ